MFERFINSEENKSEEKENKTELSPIDLEVRFNMERSLMYRALSKAGLSPGNPDEEVAEFLHNWRIQNGGKFIKLFAKMQAENEDFMDEWFRHPTSVADEMERRMLSEEGFRKAA